jgi:hypothetical protein
MDNMIDIKSLMRISKFAKLIDKSPAWVHKLAEESKIDLITIDGFHFIRVNDKFRKFVK